MKKLELVFCATLFLFSIFVAHAGKAPTPPMGWNSWNFHGKKDINEQLIMETIDALADQGFRDAGYEYVVIDGGWRTRQLGSNGVLQAHPEKFPNGIKPIADYAHSKGLKIGLHTVPGTHDCGGDAVGGYGHEEVHVQQFLDWGIDFVKVDKCLLRKKGEKGNFWTEEILETTYRKWRTLLDESGRDIILSISAYEYRDWYPAVGNMARTTYDIYMRRRNPDDKFDGGGHSVMGIAATNNKAAKNIRPGYWNDADMLITGNQGLTFEEEQAHFALWCVMSSPLILGNDPRFSTEKERSIILNKECIAVNQDPTEQGTRILENDDTEVWAKKMSHGKTAVLLINRNKEREKEISLDLNLIGIPKQATVRDLYAHKDLGTISGQFSSNVASRSCIFVVITPTP